MMPSLGHYLWWNKSVDFDAISTAIRSIYMPWAEESALHLQQIVEKTQYPGGTIDSLKAVLYQTGECLLFVDGLRFDVAKRLREMLERYGFEVSESTKWTALPSVTATGKPAVTPVKDKIHGRDASADFEPCVAQTGQSLKGGYHLQKLLDEDGWKVLEGSDEGNGEGMPGARFGDIDREGHSPRSETGQIHQRILTEIRDRIVSLISAGGEKRSRGNRSRLAPVAGAACQRWSCRVC